MSFLLQTLGPEMDQGMRNLIMSQIAKLQRMPDLALQMANYEPKPDPFVEKMKELEMMKLISEIKERDSRTQENMVDKDLKGANAELARAKTRDLNSGADNKDLDFTRVADGTAFNEEMQKEAFKHGSAVTQNAQNNASKERTSNKTAQ